ncbi:hypothetical protein ACLBR5_08450 [Escherichia coli]
MVTLENTAYFCGSSAAVHARCAVQSMQSHRRRGTDVNCSHFTFGVAMGGEQVLIFCHLADICCHLTLHIFLLSAPVMVASAQSSSVISVSGKRAEAVG